MFKEFCNNAIQNKNILMLLTVGVYVISLFATLSSNLIIASFIFTTILIVLILRNLFPLKYIITWLLIFYLGVVNVTVRIKSVDDLLNLAPLNSEITGTVISIPKGINEGKPKFFLDVKSIRFDDVEKFYDNEKVLVTLNTYKNPNLSIDELKPYYTYTFKGRLSKPFKAGNPSQFDYGNYLRNYNTYAVFYAKEFVVEDVPLSFKSKLLQSINNYRERILDIHDDYIKSPNLEILGGIVFGDDAIPPPKEIKQSFINSGLLHILAASGMNVAFIYGFFYFLMSLFRFNFKLKVTLGMITVIIYSLMTGLGASVVRATCMLLFVLIGKLIDRDAHSISLLSFVGFLMLLYNPMFINDVGFQLSFIVTFGILVMSPAFMNLKNKILDFIVSTITIPIIAQLWVVPIQIFYFNNISLYSIFANILSVPILIIISFGGFISSLLSIITPLAHFICKTFDFVLNPLISLLINISDFWGKLPHSTIQTTHPSIFQILVYYALILSITALLYKNFRNKYFKQILISLFVFLSILLVSLIPIKNSNLEIITFDVGNADCFLIKTPKNEYIMVDTGKAGFNGGKSQAEIIVLKYFKDNGIKNIHSLIVTHFDNDHCGGTIDILNNLKVDNLYVNNLNHNSIEAKTIYTAAIKNNVNLILAKNNQIIYQEGDLKLTNYLAENTDDDNENSIITTLIYHKFSMLFTGDVSAVGLNLILSKIPQNITVLKVPHHGAMNVLNKNIINYLNPKYSIISVGENKFGHPNIVTISLLNNSKILRTDIHNSIKFIINKNNYGVYTYNTTKKMYKKKLSNES